MRASPVINYDSTQGDPCTLFSRTRGASLPTVITHSLFIFLHCSARVNVNAMTQCFRLTVIACTGLPVGEKIQRVVGNLIRTRQYQNGRISNWIGQTGLNFEFMQGDCLILICYRLRLIQQCYVGL